MLYITCTPPAVYDPVQGFQNCRKTRATPGCGSQRASYKGHLRGLKTDHGSNANHEQGMQCNSLYFHTTPGISAGWPAPCPAQASAIQKLIRFRTVLCKIKGSEEDVDSRVVLVYCILKVLEGPGQFVPHIQRFVRGPEKVAKRLAVIAFEDSDPRVCEKKLVALLAGALLSQRVPTWFPEEAVIHTWLTTALQIHQSPCAVAYDTVKPNTFVLSTSKAPFGVCAALLRNIRSFVGDENMLAYIASKPRQSLVILQQPPSSSKSKLPSFRFPEHIFDQHTNPNMALLFPLEYVTSGSSPACPFGGILKRLFNECTGVNTRRENCDGFEKRPFVKDCRKVQKGLVKLGKDADELPHLKLMKTVAQTAVLPTDYLAALVGPLDVGRIKNAHMIVTQLPSDPSLLVASLKPVVRGQNEESAENAMNDEKVQCEAKQKPWLC